MIDQNELKKECQQAATVTMTLIGSCIFFAVVILIQINNQSRPAPTVNYDLYRIIAFMGGVVNLFGSFYLKERFLKKQNATGSVDTKTLGSRLMTATLVAMAMCEGPILFGLVVAFLSRNPKDLFLPIVVGIIGFTAHFPKYLDWENWTQKQ